MEIPSVTVEFQFLPMYIHHRCVDDCGGNEKNIEQSITSALEIPGSSANHEDAVKERTRGRNKGALEDHDQDIKVPRFSLVC
ncbi:hypothetical protein KM043_010065 [Ampulex compressa]|nr:hypothetical protein KM043_010065 [Ampulex compressa]